MISQLVKLEIIIFLNKQRSSRWKLARSLPHPQNAKTNSKIAFLETTKCQALCFISLKYYHCTMASNTLILQVKKPS